MRKFRCHWCIIWTKRLKSNMLWWIWEFIYFSWAVLCDGKIEELCLLQFCSFRISVKLTRLNSVQSGFILLSGSLYKKFWREAKVGLISHDLLPKYDWFPQIFVFHRWNIQRYSSHLNIWLNMQKSCLYQYFLT